MTRDEVIKIMQTTKDLSGANLNYANFSTGWNMDLITGKVTKQ